MILKFKKFSKSALLFFENNENYIIAVLRLKYFLKSFKNSLFLKINIF
jgi:hypothetical protein